MSVKHNLIDQKEYLKKYLGGDKKKKKKDKKHKRNESNLKIIDDNLFANEGNNIDEELLLTGDDAPQIVGEVIELESSTTLPLKWRNIAIKEEPNDEDNDSKHKITKFKEEPTEICGIKSNDTKIKDEFSPKKHKIKKELVDSPSKRNGHQQTTTVDSDLSPPRRRVRKDSDSDLSLPRRRKRADSIDSDLSLPRRRRRAASTDSNKSLSRRRRRGKSNDSDLSLPRRRRAASIDSNKSLSRRRHRRKSNDSDLSLRRREKPMRRNSRERYRNEKNPRGRYIQKPEFINSDNESNPNIRSRKNSEERSSGKSKSKRKIQLPEICNSDSDTTTYNKQHKNTENSRRTPVRIKEEKLTPPPTKVSRWNKRDDYQKHSPPRNNHERKSSTSPPPTHKGKASKTLDGKKSGLQDAQSLKVENEKRRREEERLFENMSKDVSGRDAEIRVRESGRKGRRAREAEAEDPEERLRREKREKEKKELYDRWGKGVKQVEDRRKQIEEEAYEASKPLARYANDEDLDRHLREQERSEDPMLEYMRQKKREEAKEDKNAPVIQKYEGHYPMNRYGIPPGYRWDGVDRSNGYEKRWFEVRNARRAREEEAYKYSVEDM